MNIYKSLNQMINYIEENLENEIKYSKLAQILGVNEYTMKSIFGLICDMSIAEYIRKRRLSNAGFDLVQTNEKIMNIAIKYQYDNATSFSRAFEKFHGIKPSFIKKNPQNLKIFAKIIFDEKVEKNDDIPYSIIEKEEMVLYGRGKKTDQDHISNDAPEFWKEMNEKYKNNAIKFGMIVYENRYESNNFEYWVLYDQPGESFEKYIIPKSKWLKFVIHSQDAKEIQKMSSQFYSNILPILKYNLKEIPELEYYHDNITEFWIPIED